MYHCTAVPQRFLSAQACFLFIEQATFVFQVSLPSGVLLLLLLASMVCDTSKIMCHSEGLMSGNGRKKGIT